MERDQHLLGGSLFSQLEPCQSRRWPSAARYSVSKLTIALSDYSAAAWLGTLIYQAMRLWGRLDAHPLLRDVLIGVGLIATIVYCVVVFRRCRSGPFISPDTRAS